MKLLILTLSLLFAHSSYSQVWNAQNSWSSEWELKYSSWIRQNMQIDFFSRETLPSGEKNPYYGLRTDCADAVYAMRIIFAYENKLPFAALDPTGGALLITEKMTRWNASSNPNQRIREFLKFAFETFSTSSLAEATYPTAMTSTAIKSGVIILTTQKNHHSWTIKDFLPIGVPQLVFSTVTIDNSSSELRERFSWPNANWVFQGNFTPSGRAGIRYWRPIDHLKSPEWKVPGYSSEQFQVLLNQWEDIIQTRLASAIELPDDKIDRIFSNLCSAMKERVLTIEDADKFLKTQGGKCMPFSDYDLYSTPSRDRRMYDEIVVLRKSYQEILKKDLKILPIKLNQLNKIFPYIKESSVKESELMSDVLLGNSDSVCEINLRNEKMDLAEFKRRIYRKEISNNSNDNYAQRWGSKNAETSSDLKCPSWDAWMPELLKNDAL